MASLYASLTQSDRLWCGLTLDRESAVGAEIAQYHAVGVVLEQYLADSKRR